jgi:hypothetical protein
MRISMLDSHQGWGQTTKTIDDCLNLFLFSYLYEASFIDALSRYSFLRRRVLWQTCNY